MTKVLHFSDSHLGFIQYGMVDRLRDFAAALSQVAKLAIDHRVDLVIDTGDTFDSAEPDPYSAKAYRIFSETLQRHQIPMIAIGGNHNRHELAAKTGNVSWMEALTAGAQRPISTSGKQPVAYWFGGPRQIDLSLIAFDWMPSQAIAAALAELRAHEAGPCDILMLHQSCSDFIPNIGAPELKLADVMGLAKYVALGDMHVTKIIESPDLIRGSKSYVASVGSTELTSISEPHQKYVNIVTFDDDKKVSYELVPLTTRPAIRFENVNSETEIEAMKGFLLSMAPEIKAANPLIHFTYNRALQFQILKFRQELVANGFTLVKGEPDTVVDYSESYLAAAQDQSADMEEILVEILGKEGLSGPAIDLWKNRNNHVEIIAALADQIRANESAQIQGPGALTI